MTSPREWAHFGTKKNKTNLQLVLLNLGGLLALGYAYLLGWIELIWNGDVTHLSTGIFIVFLLGVVYAITGRVRRASFIMNQMTTLGLIGTIIGFVIAFSGIDVVNLGDTSELPAVVGRLLDGIGAAMYTTLIGSICFVWLRVNVFILDRNRTNGG